MPGRLTQRLSTLDCGLWSAPVRSHAPPISLSHSAPLLISPSPPSPCPSPLPGTAPICRLTLCHKSSLLASHSYAIRAAFIPAPTTQFPPLRPHHPPFSFRHHHSSPANNPIHAHQRINPPLAPQIVQNQSFSIDAHISQLSRPTSTALQEGAPPPSHPERISRCLPPPHNFRTKHRVHGHPRPCAFLRERCNFNFNLHPLTPSFVTTDTIPMTMSVDYESRPARTNTQSSPTFRQTGFSVPPTSTSSTHDVTATATSGHQPTSPRSKLSNSSLNAALNTGRTQSSSLALTGSQRSTSTDADAEMTDATEVSTSHLTCSSMLTVDL